MITTGLGRLLIRVALLLVVAGAWLGFAAALARTRLSAPPGTLWALHVETMLWWPLLFYLGVGHGIFPRPGGRPGRPRSAWIGGIAWLGAYAGALSTHLGVGPGWALVRGMALIGALAWTWHLIPRLRWRPALHGVVVLPLLLAPPGSGSAAGEPDPAAIYRDNCASCHGPDRLGASGPPLLDVTLRRKRPEVLAGVIRTGRPFTGMPAFGAMLSDAEIAALAHWIQRPATAPVSWGLVRARATRSWSPPAPATGPPVADRWNLFVVVEAGDHHVTILDGDRLTPIARIPTARALHGGPKFTPDGRFCYYVTRGGWVGAIDLFTLRELGRVRVAVAARNLALGPRGKLLVVTTILPAGWMILRAQGLEPLRWIPAPAGARPEATYLRPRHAEFLTVVPEERLLGRTAVTAATARWPTTAVALPVAVRDFALDPSGRWLVGSDRRGGAVVVELTTGRVVARPDLGGMPHLGSGIWWRRGDGLLFATPDMRAAGIRVYETRSWRLLTTIPTDGPGFFLRSHAASPYAWADVFFGPHRDELHVIDKRTLEVVRTVTPAPGRLAAHVEFDRHGRYALVSVMEDRGELVVYTADGRRVVRRLPARHPIGKYNVANKVRLDPGTSR